MSDLGFAWHSRLGLSPAAQFPLSDSALDPSGFVMVSVQLPLLSAASQFDFSHYWSEVLGAQSFFEFVTPDAKAFDDSVRAFSAETLKRFGAIDVCATVTLTREGDIIISGRHIRVRGNAPVRLSKISPNDNIFRADQPWQKYARITNSKSQSDAFARHLNGAGFADAIEVDDSGALGQAILGSVILHSDVATLFLASAGSTIPQFEPLVRAGLFSEARAATMGAGVNLLSLGDVSRSWWVSPKFEVHPATFVSDARAGQMLAQALPSQLTSNGIHAGFADGAGVPEK